MNENQKEANGTIQGQSIIIAHNGFSLSKRGAAKLTVDSIRVATQLFESLWSTHGVVEMKLNYICMYM